MRDNRAKYARVSIWDGIQYIILNFRRGDTLTTVTSSHCNPLRSDCVRWLKLWISSSDQPFHVASCHNTYNCSHSFPFLPLSFSKVRSLFLHFCFCSLFSSIALFACFTSLISIRLATQRIRNANFKLKFKFKFKYSLIYKIIIIVVVDYSHSRCRCCWCCCCCYCCCHCRSSLHNLVAVVLYILGHYLMIRNGSTVHSTRLKFNSLTGPIESFLFFSALLSLSLSVCRYVCVHRYILFKWIKSAKKIDNICFMYITVLFPVYVRVLYIHSHRLYLTWYLNVCVCCA